MKCPCINCLCIPACRYKSYYQLLDCALVLDYLHASHIGYQDAAIKVAKTLGLQPIFFTSGIYSEKALISQLNTFGKDRNDAARRSQK